MHFTRYLSKIIFFYSPNQRVPPPDPKATAISFTTLPGDGDLERLDVEEQSELVPIMGVHWMLHSRDRGCVVGSDSPSSARPS